MNEFLQNNLIAIIVFLLMVIFLMMGSMIFILFKLLTKEKGQSQIVVEHAKPQVKIVPVKNEETVVEKYYCVNHTEDPSVGSCLMCEDVFCENCLVEHEGMHFCKEHFKVYANHRWRQITDVRTTPDTPEAGLFVYKFKKAMWKKNVPSFVLTHYKINIEEDFIESFVQLNVREEDAEQLSSEIKQFKAIE